MQKKIDKIMPLVVIMTLIIFAIGMVIRSRANAETEENGEQYYYESTEYAPPDGRRFS